MSALLGTIGFAAAFCLFAALAVLLRVSWRGKMEGGLLIAAAALTAGWAAVTAVEPWSASVPVSAVVLAELLRDGAWLLFLSALLRKARLPLLIGSAGAIWVLAVVLAAAGASGALRALPDPREVLIMSGLLLSVIVLVFLEQIFRNTASETDREKMKYLVLGLAAVFVYDLYTYAEALLLEGIDATLWSARGYVAALAAPLIAVAARRQAAWSVTVYVSRHATFYGTAVTAIGVYLILMAAAGYGIRLYGGEWGALAQIVFLAGAVVVLAAMILSPRVRRDLRVVLNKHFYKSRYDYRREWLRFAESLAAPRDRDGLHAAAIECVARIVDGSSGLLWAEDATGAAYETVSAWPERLQRPRRIPKADAAIDFIRRTKWIVDLAQYAREPDAYDHVALPAAWRDCSDVRLVVPLFLRDDLLGFVTLSGEGVREKLNYEDHDLLKTVGSQIATYLNQEEIQRHLSVSQQFEAYHRLSAFMLHDLKNIIAQQSLVLRNAERHKGNPAFIDDALSTVSNSVQRMNRMLSTMRSADPERARRVAVGDVIRQSVQNCAHGRPVPEVRMPDGACFVSCQPDRLAGALEHLIRNAQQATSADGRVSVGVRVQDGTVSISIEDDGVGMDEDFVRNRLFVPFDTTKGSQGMGIGAYQAREAIRAIGGRLDVESAPGRGTVFTIALPLDVERPMPAAELG